ncbi:hypothetical protein D7X33_19390 [Butyricicoccus sp. 1XD8-22]|nr:hypothetical protein D7X33_19390 [Butyricicoccus sp. 1XD8-22]
MTGASSGQSVAIFNADGRLTKDRVLNALASNETLKDKEAFVASQVARGVDRSDAIQDWNTNHAANRLADNKKHFGDSHISKGIDSGFKANQEAFVRASNTVPTIGQKLKAMGHVMTMDAVESVGKHSNAIKGGFDAAQVAVLNSSREGAGVLKTIKTVATGGFDAVKQNYAQQGIEATGSAVEAQAKFQDSIGYAGGVLFGASGYVGAKKLGMKISPYKNQVDNEIYSASDVAQMAQTTVDNGTVKISDGAIRQVVTADSSYIEVLTRSGERKRVSTINAGDSGLEKGAIVYQDLDVKDNMLVPVQRGNSSTYHIDSGGAKVPSDVQIIQNPNTMLKKGTIQTVNSQASIPTSVPTVHVASAANDSYAPNEVQQLALATTGANGQPQIARGAIRQVVTDSQSYIEVQGHDGKKHRVSPIGKGNPSLSNGQVLYQDLDVQDGQYVPLVANVSGTKSTTYAVNSNGQRMATQQKIMQNPNDLVRTTRVQSAQSSTLAFPKGKEYPSFSQFVDSGQFFTDDLVSQGFQNLNVVVENERRFVTGEKDGVRYRVSPVYSGDTRMGSNEVKEIPLTIEQGKLVPQKMNRENGASAKVYVKNAQNEVKINDDTTHYSSKVTENLIVSRSLLNATRSAESRKLLESARQPQGILE